MEQVVQRLAMDGYQVRLFMRHQPAWPPPQNVELHLGDAKDLAAVVAAARGCDAVVNTIGSLALRTNTVESDTTAVAVEATTLEGVRRYIGMSAGMVAPVSFVFDHIIRPIFFSNLMREHIAVERIIRTSQLDSTIVRPSMLSNKPASGFIDRVDARPRGPIRISRADVAAFISNELSRRKYVGAAVFVISK
jgi:uncharacterized protein YbjT (DUF2867 family)